MFLASHNPEDETVELDLANMPDGERYEDRYGAYLQFFYAIAHTPISEDVMVRNAPWSWWPLLHYLQCYGSDTAREYFPYCGYVKRALQNNPDHVDRTVLEVLCSFRPETADALWKIDMQWTAAHDRVIEFPDQHEFIVTTNGAYHRKEVKDYMAALANYKPHPDKIGVVLVPCAADKPYPALLHKKVLEIMPRNFYMANATGVVGIVPQDLWTIMPWYDSGIPNEWRLFQIGKRYFGRVWHQHIVVYCDYYSLTLKELFWNMRLNDKVEYVVEPKFYPDYLPLHEPQYLDKLQAVFERITNGQRSK
jgi:hypothetical protein